MLGIPAVILMTTCHNEWIAFFVKVHDHLIDVVATNAAPDVGVDRIQTAVAIWFRVAGNKGEGQERVQKEW